MCASQNTITLPLAWDAPRLRAEATPIPLALITRTLERFSRNAVDPSVDASSTTMTSLRALGSVRTRLSSVRRSSAPSFFEMTTTLTVSAAGIGLLPVSCAALLRVRAPLQPQVPAQLRHGEHQRIGGRAQPDGPRRRPQRAQQLARMVKMNDGVGRSGR